MQSSCSFFAKQEDLPYIDTQIQKWKDEGRLDASAFDHLADGVTRAVEEVEDLAVIAANEVKLFAIFIAEVIKHMP